MKLVDGRQFMRTRTLFSDRARRSALDLAELCRNPMDIPAGPIPSAEASLSASLAGPPSPHNRPPYDPSLACLFAACLLLLAFVFALILGV